MNYYEELGLPQSATLEQIQEAYRSLAIVLHPDRQQTQGLKSIADHQMRRLNGIISVLKDPVARWRYDASLLPKTTPCSSTPSAIGQEALSTRIIWCCCLVIGCGGIFSYLLDDIRHTRMIESSQRPGFCTEAAILQIRVTQLEQEINRLRVRRRAGEFR